MIPKIGQIISYNGIQLKVEKADRDGSGCFVCDNGEQKCYFSDKRDECLECEEGLGVYPFYNPQNKIVFIE